MILKIINLSASSILCHASSSVFWTQRARRTRSSRTRWKSCFDQYNQPWCCEQHAVDRTVPRTIICVWRVSVPPPSWRSPKNHQWVLEVCIANDIIQNYDILGDITLYNHTFWLTIIIQGTEDQRGSGWRLLWRGDDLSTEYKIHQ